MTEETRNVIMRNGKMYVGGDVTKEYVDNAIANAVADIDDDISALSDTVEGKVDKVDGKGLSTNDYTDADKALVADSPITVTATASPISTANGKPRAITIYGKSEIVDGVIKSAGEGWATVDLGTLNWIIWNEYFYAGVNNRKAGKLNLVCEKYPISTTLSDKYCLGNQDTNIVYIKDTDYTDATAFKTAMSGVTLCYQLADPTQGNCIAVKTDNGSGIDGTMATFATGTPLYGVSDTVRDVMQWDGSSGEVTKKCAKVRLADLTWTERRQAGDLYVFISHTPQETNSLNGLCNKYTVELQSAANRMSNKSLMTFSRFWSNTKFLVVRDDDYTTVSDFVASLGDATLCYELATPTTEQLTQAENESLSALKTYSPQTAITINDNPEFEVEAYANTANGQAISDMQPTRSPLFTLSASGWTNNAQTVSYEHDTGKRNTIDVEPTSIKAWTAAGILATSETASTITFECDTVPTADLSFRVTSMEVR